MQQQIPPTKITNKGKIYYIDKSTNTLSKKQPINKEQESSSTKWKRCKTKKKTATITNYRINMNTGRWQQRTKSVK